MPDQRPQPVAPAAKPVAPAVARYSCCARCIGDRRRRSQVRAQGIGGGLALEPTDLAVGSESYPAGEVDRLPRLAVPPFAPNPVSSPLSPRHSPVRSKTCASPLFDDQRFSGRRAAARAVVICFRAPRVRRILDPGIRVVRVSTRVQKGRCPARTSPGDGLNRSPASRHRLPCSLPRAWAAPTGRRFRAIRAFYVCGQLAQATARIRCRIDRLPRHCGPPSRRIQSPRRTRTVGPLKNMLHHPIGRRIGPSSFA